MTPQPVSVPGWVLSTICLVGCCSVPALVIVASCGAVVNPYVDGVVGTFAMQTAVLAFGWRGW